MSISTIVIGGGAAGFFAAITAAQSHPSVLLLEKTNTLLAKVRISGGGRCNVTHSCFDPHALVKNYPRGEKELIGPFHQFQPRDTMEWFQSRGVELKTEEDGRIFPVSDDSQTIIDCLFAEAKKLGVNIRLQQNIRTIEKQENGFRLELESGEELFCQKLILATGSSKGGYALAETLGHHIVAPVPSLFTFNLPDLPLKELSGISVEPVSVQIAETKFHQHGPLLITHWGFSGPAVLKLSAWAARHLHSVNYCAEIKIDWLPQLVSNQFLQLKHSHPTDTLNQHIPPSIARQLWKKLLEKAHIDPHARLNTIPNKVLTLLYEQLRSDSYMINGKTTYKQEFVTCGGIALEEVNFKTMESRLCKGLYFAGEVLNIDGITGGFNFQNAWTTGWIAGQQKS